jgi:hypothetical protein
MNRWLYRAWLAVSLALATGAAAAVVRTLQDPRTSLDFFYNPDYISPAALYQDVVGGGCSLRTYQFSAATFAVPDVATYVAVRAVVGDTAPAVLAWEALLFMLLAGSGAAAAAAVTPRPARPLVWPAVLCWVAFYLAVVARQFFYTNSLDLLLPVYHNGAVALSLLGVACVVRGSASVHRQRWLTALAVLCFLATFSDRLFGLYFAAPVALALVGLRLGRRPHAEGSWPKIIALLLAVALGCGAALVALRLCLGGVDPLGNYWSGVVWRGAGSRLRVLLTLTAGEVRNGNVLVLAAAGWYAACAASGGVALVRRVRRTPAESPSWFAYYQTYSVAILALVGGVFILSDASRDYVRMGEWGKMSRYFLGPIGVAFFGCPLLFARAASAGNPVPLRLVGVLTPTGLAAVFVGITLTSPRTRQHDLSNYYPEYVRRVDEACEQYGMRRGLAGYWQAKTITCLSRSGVRVNQVTPHAGLPFGMAAFHWLSHAEAYWEDVGDGYEFVVTSDSPHYQAGADLITRDVIAAVGEPSAALPAGPYRVLVYRRPQDTDGIHRFHELNSSVLNLKHWVDPTATIRYPGNSFVAPGDHPPAPGRERVAAAGRTPAGPLGYGPYLRPRRAGRYAVTARLTSSGTDASNGWVEVLYIDPVRKTCTPVARETIPPRSAGEVTISFAVSEAMRAGLLEFRPVFTGEGELVFHWIDFGPQR